MYAKDLSEPKYEILNRKREYAGIKHFSDPNSFIDCSNTIDGFIRILTITNLAGKKKKIIVFDDMIADTMSNKKSVLFFCSKICWIKFDTLFDDEN